MLDSSDRETLRDGAVSARDGLAGVRRTADDPELTLEASKRAARNLGVADGTTVGTRLELHGRKRELADGRTDDELVRLYEHFESADESVQTACASIEGLAPRPGREATFGDVEGERYDRCETELAGTLGRFEGEDDERWLDRWDAVSAGGGFASLLLGGPGGAVVGAGSASVALLRPLVEGLFGAGTTNEDLAEQYVAYRETVECLKPVLTSMTAYRLAGRQSPGGPPSDRRLETFYGQLEVELTELRMVVMESERIYDVPDDYAGSVDLEGAVPLDLPGDDPDFSNITESYVLGRYLAVAVLLSTVETLGQRDEDWTVHRREVMDVLSKSFRHLMTMEQLDDLGGIRIDDRRAEIRANAQEGISALERAERRLQ